MKVAVLIPCYNESLTIEKVVAECSASTVRSRSSAPSASSLR